MKKFFIPIIILALITGFLAGHLIDRSEKAAKIDSHDEPAGKEWVCSMHPEVRSDKPGKCNICGMDLVLAHSSPDRTGKGPSKVTLSSAATKIAGVTTAKVKRAKAVFKLPLSGKIKYDETLKDAISAHFDCRIEKLYVNYLGLPIHKGEHIARIFSADISVARRELQFAIKSMLEARNSADEKKIASAKEVLYSARNKLNSWGFLNKQIVEMAKDPGTSPEIDILAPTSGVVIESNMREGQYFKRGDKLLTIVDTSVMWLMLDAYERDLPFLRYGQKISFTVQSIPGKTFSGRIAFIAPEFDPATRTVMVRANVPNSSGELKAGMFARANVEITLGHGGQVVIDELENKWIGPMHPEIIRSAPGDCPVCGMKLIPASSLPGMHHKKGKLPLLIPASAPLLTGKRAIVYVESKPGVYSAREVVLGPKAGDQYIVKDGLKEEEVVVSRGSFVVDSALQITGGESMMNRLETSDNKGSKELIHSIGSEPLNNLVNAYCQLVQELAADKLAEAKEAAKKIASIELPDELQKNITKPAEELSKSPDISKARHELFVISGELIKLVENNRKMLNAPLYENYCPMAFNNKGAMWLQKNKILINPYFGNAMLHCGSTRKIIKP